MKNNQKGISSILVIIILALIVIAGGYYYIQSSKIQNHIDLTEKKLKEEALNVNSQASTTSSKSSTTTKPITIDKKPVIKTPVEPVPKTDILTTYRDQAGISFNYDATKNNVYTAISIGQPIIVKLSSKETYSGGDYTASKYYVNLYFLSSYDPTRGHKPDETIEFTQNNKDANFDIFVEGYKNSPTFFDGRGWGEAVTKTEERKINNQRAVVIYRGNHINNVIFHTKPYSNAPTFIGILDVDTAIVNADETDKIVAALMNTFTENIQETYIKH